MSMRLPVRQAVVSSPDYPFDPLSALVKLDQNELSEDFPNELKAIVLERIAKIEWNRYPDLNAETMRAAIAEFEGWNPSGMVVTTGSNVLVSLLIQLSALGRRVATVKPNFALYGLDARLLGARLIEVPLRADHSLDIAAVIASLRPLPTDSEAPAGVTCPRPNAPTGSLCSLEELDRLAKASRNWLTLNEPIRRNA